MTGGLGCEARLAGGAGTAESGTRSGGPVVSNMAMLGLECLPLAARGRKEGGQEGRAVPTTHPTSTQTLLTD